MVDCVDFTAWAKLRGLKKPYPLIFHLLDTAAMALALWDRFLTRSQRQMIAKGLGVPEDQARSMVSFWAGIHDIGKLTPGFARCGADGWEQVSAVLRGDEGAWKPERHDVAGLRVVSDLLADLGYAPGGSGPKGTAWRVAQIVGGHHGVFHCRNYLEDCTGEYAADGLGGQQWHRQRELHVRTVYEVLGSPVAPVEVPAASGVLITGLVILADWLASQERFIVGRQARPSATVEDHFAQTMRGSGKVLADAGLNGSAMSWTPFDYASLFGITHANPLQRSIFSELAPVIEGTGPGILVVTTMMGDGKTELALGAMQVMSAAAGTDGFFLGLPTMATSDHMYLRVRDYARLATVGPAAVTLAHSMAWLNTAYGDPLLAEVDRFVTGEGGEPGRGDRDRGRTAASKWLRGSKRPLLARVGVGTVDQALAAVLPVPHNALRLLALSGRTLIIDEAHAYDPYMQVLLQRLLVWLAAYGCPVVLLSATLPASTVDRLVRSYLQGARWMKRDLPADRFTSAYPGWVYVDAASAAVTRVSDPVAVEQASQRRTLLQVDVRQVHHHDYEPGDALPERSRFTAIAQALEELVESGGTAAVVCTTVADAQQTYEYVRDVVLSQPGHEDVTLLHARFPADQRETETSDIVTRLGKKGPRPQRMIVVATQVIEQSLDLDVDILISDLAPVALLLQRAGRCWRHERFWSLNGRLRDRPGWSRGPRLVILVPTDDGGQLTVPKMWGSVYHPYLLDATNRLLCERNGKSIDLPGDVQDLVEAVHGDGSAFAAEVDAINTASARSPGKASRASWDGEVLAQRSIADCVVIPTPRNVVEFNDLHHLSFPDTEVGTRLGIDSVRVVCCYEQPDGRLTLDPAGRDDLPQPDAEGDGLFRPEQVRSVMAKTIPVAGNKLTGRGADTDVPPTWQENSWLAELVLLPHRQSGGGWRGPQVGKRSFQLDPELGLVMDG